MGISAKDSRIFVITPECPIELDGTPPGNLFGSGSGANSGALSEQVLRIEVTPSVFERKYGHDKSYGAQDVTTGIKSWDGTITTLVASGTNPFTLTAGNVVWVRVFPIGQACGKVIQGYAVIGSDPIECNLEQGQPVGHVYRFSSKGVWTGLGGNGFSGECECNSGSVGGSTSILALEDAEESTTPRSIPRTKLKARMLKAAPKPVTAYQWNGSVWGVVMDETRKGYTAGAAPTEPGTFAGQIIFSPCVRVKKSQ